MKYPCMLIADKNGGYVVAFPDIPEAATQGETEEEALAMAREALETALEFYFEDKRVVPHPSRPKPGQHVVDLPPSLSAKVLLLNEMVIQNIRPAELARRLKITPQAVTRMTDLKHSTRIDGIDAALRALGRRMEIHLAR
ncbi:MAG: type II toxin-antitoxin system HicB family antitoxin [Deltaproteobacteria bacterium]|jgi:antitoxin HicB|nr:type II toxin-antitoxin system HicB family antitoxin [Deltaproteobacteria bacterium]